MTTQRRLIPDLDDELTTALAHAEELLLEVAAWETDAPEITWPEPLAGGQALAAVRRLWDAVAPTQDLRAAAAQPRRLLAPDGRYEHIPLRLADIDPADAGILAAAAAIFSNRRAPDHVRQALEAGAEIAYGHCDDGACTWLALTTTRLAELFSMIPDHDSEVLAATMQRDQEHDIVLASGSEAAYRRYATRANQIWQAGDPLHLWQY
jgi:hypothetical protein